MDCFLFGGAPTVGKSEGIHRLALYLLTKGFKDIHLSVPVAFKDFIAVIEGPDKNGKIVRIIINTATDTPAIIQNFKTFYDKNGTYDFLISSIRDYHFWPRADFFSIMGINHTTHKILEFPLAKITRRGTSFTVALKWYYDHVDSLVQHILRLPPFNLF